MIRSTALRCERLWHIKAIIITLIQYKQNNCHRRSEHRNAADLYRSCSNGRCRVSPVIVRITGLIYVRNMEKRGYGMTDHIDFTKGRIVLPLLKRCAALSCLSRQLSCSPCLHSLRKTVERENKESHSGLVERHRGIHLFRRTHVFRYLFPWRRDVDPVCQ